MNSEVYALFERYGPRYKWLATGTVVTGTLCVVLASTIVNVAIPAIMADMRLEQTQAQWLSTAFLAAMTTAMLVAAWAVEAYGQRNTYLGALAIFIAASVVGGLAPDPVVLILARVVQGAMAGIVQPLAMVTIFRVFPPTERGLGVGIYGLGVILSPALGPSLGGVLVDTLSWRAVFFVVLPPCLISLVLARFFMPPREGADERVPLDWVGLTLLVCTITGLLWIFTNAHELGWGSGTIRGLLATTLAGATAFMLWQLRCPRPLLNLRIYRSLGFACGSLLSFALGATLFGVIYLVPMFVQHIQGFTATASGLVLIPAGLVMAAFFPFSGYLSDRLPIQLPILAGLMIMVAGLLLLAGASLQTGFWALAFWVALTRLGQSLMSPAISAGSLAALDARLLTQGSGAMSFARQLGGAFGVNLISMTLERLTIFHTQKLSREANNGSESLERIKAAYGGLETLAHRALEIRPDGLEPVIWLAGYTRAFQESFFILGMGFFAAVLPAWAMGRALASRRPAKTEAPRRLA